MSTNYKVSVSGFFFSDFDDIFMRRELLSESTSWSWGNNSIGQLGTNNTTARSSPGTLISGPYNIWRQIGTGGSHFAGVKTDGTLWLAGLNSSGQLGDNSTTNRSSPVTTAGSGSNWKQVYGGGSHSAAVKSDGTLWVWGLNSTGQVGDGTTTTRSSPVTTTGGGTNWKYVTCGNNSTAAIKTDGTLWVWGLNSSGQLGTANTTNTSSPWTVSGGGTNWATVSMGVNHSGGVKTDGTLWMWGLNSSGQLGTANTTNASSPWTVSGGGTNWRFLSCGEDSTVAIKTDGTIWAWGINTFGQLGDNSTTNRSSPVTVAGGGTTWKSASNANFVVALKSDGTLWSWGRNNFGQLGNGNTTDVSSPVTISGTTPNWKQVSVGSNFTIALQDLSF